MKPEHASGQPTAAAPRLVLRGMGALHAGGGLVSLSGLPARQHVLAEGGSPVTLDPNGQYPVGQMYAQYFLPAAPRRALPLLLWHGGGLSGACWETTPDGRPGWLLRFIEAGWDTYLCDAAERGRSGFAPVPEVWPAPLSQTASDVFKRFRLGAAPAGTPIEELPGHAYPGQQFPVHAFGQFIKQLVPRWTHTDAAIFAAYEALLEQTGPSVVVCHSQGGMFGLRAALAHPRKVRAVVALEPAAVPLQALRENPLQVPVLIVLGDHMQRDARWPAMRERILEFAAASPRVDVLDLPRQGIAGNSHMLMMDANSDRIAEHVDAWLDAAVGRPD